VTSANVIEYVIQDATGQKVGEHRQHQLCKTHWDKLLVFEPLEQHTITPQGYDEEEEFWEGDPMNLREFLIKVRAIKDDGTTTKKV